MAKSIIPFDSEGRCYLCQKKCATETYYIFGGSNQDASDKYGLTIQLCYRCLCEAHEHPEEFERHYILKSRAQIDAMDVYDWSIDEFRNHFREETNP